ncbi:MAG: hypothetical protein U5N55_05025 [Cypionkella sp.]|nr:hypothetical protein [Cypionkella sp.]
MNVFLDIETIPTQSREHAEQIGASIAPPSSMKKAETIAAWEADEKPKAVADAVAKTSFDPAFGHICTIAWAVDNGKIEVAHAPTIGQERDVLSAFFASIPPDTFAAPTFVGHYIGGFDLRFILCRAVVLGVPIPPQIPRDPKPWDKSVFDTMSAWAGAKGAISMDKLARALGLKGKSDFDGSMVAQAWLDGEHDKIADYCKSDVATTRSIHSRFAAVNW